MSQPRQPADWSQHWTLDPAITFLNHGSFGACPRVVLEEQQHWRQRIERQPVQFFVRDLERCLDSARAVLAAFLGADCNDVAFVPNATAGVNAVVRSLRFDANDEVLVTDHAYNACRNALEFAAARSGARVVVAAVPFPVASPEQIIEAVLAEVTQRTRLVLLDHVTSPTALIFPIESLVRALAERGVDTLIDGAHAPGMLDLDVGAIGAAYYTGNCHKWLCAPKGAGFLWVRRDRQAAIRPTVISHGANSTRRERSRFLLEFDWTGTHDPTPYLCIPAALSFMGGLLAGGWTALRQHNHTLAVKARRQLCATLQVAPFCPDTMLGSMATVALPPGSASGPTSPLYTDPLQEQLLSQYQIEVPVFSWPAAPRRWVRISAQIYNVAADYERLGQTLRGLA